jgi:ketosteroid isomerase-like protein
VMSSAADINDRAPVSCVEMALGLADAINRGDIGTVLALVTEDVQILSAAAPATGVAEIGQGRAGLRRWLTQLEAQGRRARLIVSECREVNGRAVSTVAVTNERDGKYDVATVIWSVATLNEEGKIKSTWSFRSEAEALRAARTGRPD